MSEVVDLFGNDTSEPKSPPNYHMQVKRQNGDEVFDVIGYPHINGAFAAVCSGPGIIQWVTTLENLDFMINKGEVPETTN